MNSVGVFDRWQEGEHCQLNVVAKHTPVTVLCMVPMWQGCVDAIISVAVRPHPLTGMFIICGAQQAHKQPGEAPLHPRLRAAPCTPGTEDT
jgi:hypothetical protein